MTKLTEKSLLVTGALPYANGPIHIGHLVEYVQADIWVRYWKLRGRDTVFLCADDTHGTPIMLRAQKEGISPEELIHRVWKEHTRDFAGFDVDFDLYYSTHSEENRKLSEEIFSQLSEAGHVVSRDIEQAYCPEDQMFLPDRFVLGGCPYCGAEDQYGDACEVCSKTYNSRELRSPYCSQCGAAPEWRRSEHLFFRLGDFTEFLKSWVPDRTQEEVTNKLTEWFESGLKDWDISRDHPYFGFEIPGHPRKYFYVWLDAPVGYMAATRHYCEQTGRSFDFYWREEEGAEVYHFIGKDIVYFHALFWPAMLQGASFRTPTGLYVHGFLTVDGEKMSKTRGTFIRASTYLEHLDPQYLRYYYAAKLTPRVEDLDLNFDDFVARVNSDLVNRLANIPSRTVKILHKNNGGRLEPLDTAGHALVETCRSRVDAVADLYEARAFSQVVRELADLGDLINTFIQDREPWKIAKSDPRAAAAICSAALEGFRVIATLIQPILPRWGSVVASLFELESLEWQAIGEPLGGHPIAAYQRLVERVDREKIDAMTEASRESSEKEVEVPSISSDPLLSCHFETPTVAEVEALGGAYWKLRFEEEPAISPVVAGLGEEYDPEHLVGSTVLVLANLEAKTIAGEESHGMLLAGIDRGRTVVAEVSRSRSPRGKDK